MKKPFNTILSAGLLLSFLATAFLPVAANAAVKKTTKKKKRTYYHISVSAIPAADERDFDNPVSRCLTADMKALNKKAVDQMEVESKKYPTKTEAIKKYKENLDTLWSAMAEPYCGYGGYGMTAVKKSFEKSVEHVHAECLADVKK
jgi:hypothetical protein